jgi:hypothetical protein
MSHNFTQPEEIDLALQELNTSDVEIEVSTTLNMHAKTHEGRHARYTPPYRAAYLSENAGANL